MWSFVVLFVSCRVLCFSWLFVLCVTSFSSYASRLVLGLTLNPKNPPSRRSLFRVPHQGVSRLVLHRLTDAAGSPKLELG